MNIPPNKYPSAKPRDIYSFIVSVELLLLSVVDTGTVSVEVELAIFLVPTCTILFIGL